MIYLPKYAEIIPGWMDTEELTWLYLQSSKMSSVVEIGAWCGRSTYALLCGCAGNVTTVDHFYGTPSELNTTHKEATTEDIYAKFISYVGMFPNLKVLRTDSVTAATMFSEKSIDMVFIDGDHSESAVFQDIQAWSPICKKLICGHDRNLSGVSTIINGRGWNIQEGPGSIWYTYLD
jgi:predicted O-methyltransferase YrrM